MIDRTGQTWEWDGGLTLVVSSKPWEHGTEHECLVLKGSGLNADGGVSLPEGEKGPVLELASEPWESDPSKVRRA